MVCYNFKIMENSKRIGSGVCKEEFKNSYDKFSEMGVISDYKRIEFNLIKDISLGLSEVKE